MGIAEKSVPFAQSVGFGAIWGDITIYKTNITNDVPFYHDTLLISSFSSPRDLMKKSQVDYETILEAFGNTAHIHLAFEMWRHARDISTTPLKRLALQLFPTYAARLFNIQQKQNSLMMVSRRGLISMHLFLVICTMCTSSSSSSSSSSC